MATIGGSGCSYTSSYVPPVDGRARVIWNSQDSEATVTLAGGSLSRDCQGAIRQLTGQERVPVGTGFVQLPSLDPPEPYQLASYRGEYVPRYYGPTIIVVQPGLAPHLPRPPLFIPGLGRPGFPPSRIAPPLAGGVRMGSGGGGRGFGGSSMGSGGGDAGKAFVVLAVVAIVVMPVISITLATVRPESERQASQAIDAANAYNDMLRSGNSPCDPELVPEAGGSS